MLSAHSIHIYEHNGRDMDVTVNTQKERHISILKGKCRVVYTYISGNNKYLAWGVFMRVMRVIRVFRVIRVIVTTLYTAITHPFT